MHKYGKYEINVTARLVYDNIDALPDKLKTKVRL